MDNTDYYEDGAERVLRLMKETFGNTFKAYFNGEVEEVNAAYLPCIIVTVAQADVSSGPTTADDIKERIIVIVALDRREDLGADPESELTEARVRKYIMGQDKETAQYLPNTVVYAIRKHLTMNIDTLQSDITIDFLPNNRGENGTPTQEGIVTINLKRRIFVPERD